MSVVEIVVDRELDVLDAKGKPTGRRETKAIRYRLHFGMRAVEVMATRMITEAPDSSIKWLTDITHAGLVNEDYLEGRPETSYRATAELVEDILDMGAEVQNQIIEAFNSSKASRKITEMLEALIPAEQKKNEKESGQVKANATDQATDSKTKPIGTKSKSTLLKTG